MKTFLICPVRGHEQSETEAIVKKLEMEGWEVHWPPRDTKQDNDPTGLRICKDNRQAIIDAGNIHIVWDGKSQGVLFDAGMAFMADLLLPAGINVYIESLPDFTEGKSYQNMMADWAGL